MKIAINCQFWILRGGGGIKEYIANLVNHLEKVDHQNEYVLYVLEDQFEDAKTKLPARFKLKPIPYQRNFVSKVKRSLFAQSFWSKEERDEGFDVFHSPFFHAPKMKKARVIMTVHDLRHTAASLMVQSGANVKTVQRTLGHASAAMTLDVYADLFDSELDAVASNIDGIIGESKHE